MVIDYCRGRRVAKRIGGVNGTIFCSEFCKEMRRECWILDWMEIGENERGLSFINPLVCLLVLVLLVSFI